ncbi:PI31 proteasome regulator N-terminal-domain-containing protein [Daldinia sp. FL1419]|nr:PI31 proteasome regulator N-terminal-domain-containing protein [Daldinia sp. FL1419]
MSTNPLRWEAILQQMADALPTHPQGDTTSDLSSSHEALALLTHACMTSLGFRLIGFDEDKLDEARCHELAPRLPPNWNASFNTYAFVYAHQQSALRFVVRIDRMGGKAEIRGLGINDERIARVEVTIKDFVSNAALPIRITVDANGVEDRSNLLEVLKRIFISEARIEDLANQINTGIIQNLVPSLHKEGYEESHRREAEDPDDRAAREYAEDVARRPPRQPVVPEPQPEGARPRPFDVPIDPPPRPAPVGDFPPPGFEDPYDINRPYRYPPRQPGRSPFGNIGADDLNPPGLGPHDPLRPGLGIGGGLPRHGGGRGMHPTFDDPMFGGPRGDDGDFDPQVPPGARYDPLGPGGVPRFGGYGPRGGGSGQFGGGGFGGFGGGDII